MVSPECIRCLVTDVPQLVESTSIGPVSSVTTAAVLKDCVVPTPVVLPVVDILLPNYFGATEMDPLLPNLLGVTALDPLLLNHLEVTAFCESFEDMVEIMKVSGGLKR